MKTEAFSLSDIPVLLYGAPSARVWLHVHGKMGYKEEAERFAEIACPRGWQVLSLDLPEHGQRKGRPEPFTPWAGGAELRKLLAWMRPRWEHISLYATSMGVWFSMLALSEEPLERALFVSPVVDMEQLIRKLMRWAKVTEAQLEREKIIPTELGETLSWDYYSFVREHPIRHWEVPTAILFGERDHLTDLETVEMFARRFGAELEVIPDSRHWFQDPTQLAALAAWTERQLSAC